jgi:hypothetical protein
MVSLEFLVVYTIEQNQVTGRVNQVVEKRQTAQSKLLLPD